MMLHGHVAAKIQALPPPLLREVENFIDFLLLRYQGNMEEQGALNSQAMTQIAVDGGAFDWLLDPAEDGIYTDADGEPV